MKALCIVSTILSAALLVCPVRSDEMPKAGSGDRHTCKSSNSLSNQQIEDCIQADMNAADAELNEAYKDLLDAIGDKENWRNIEFLQAKFRAQVISSERAWVKYKIEECGLQYMRDTNGLMAPIDGLACSLKMTQDRTAELKKITDEINSVGDS